MNHHQGDARVGPIVSGSKVVWAHKRDILCVDTKMNSEIYLTVFGIFVLFVFVFVSTFSAGHFGDDTLSSLFRSESAQQEQLFLDPDYHYL